MEFYINMHKAVISNKWTSVTELGLLEVTNTYMCNVDHTATLSVKVNYRQNYELKMVYALKKIDGSSEKY